jgi:hypothetical protein
VRTKITFKDCQIVDLAKYPGEDGPTQVLQLRALLTRPLASILRCDGICFTDSNMPRRFKKVTLLAKIEDAEINMPIGTYGADLLNFSVAPPARKSKTDASLEVSFSLHLAGQIPLSDWVDSQNKEAFTMTAKPPEGWDAQAELFTDDSKDKQEASEPEKEAPEPARQIPPRNHGQIVDITAEK